MRSTGVRGRAALTAALVLALLARVSVLPAQAQDAGRVSQCPAIRADAARLACFDAAMKPPPGPFDPNAIPDTPAPAAITTAPLAAARVVQADDAFVTPNKYVGQMIAIPGMKCLYADRGDYRCLGLGSMTFAVFAKAIGPHGQREAIERECGELSKVMVSPSCLRTVRFVPAKAETDVVSGFQQRVIMRADTIEIEDVGPAARPASARR